MSDRLSHRCDPYINISAEIAADEASWRGRTAEDLAKSLKARTLRSICRNNGINPGPRRTALACARAIAQHSADLDMGRA